MSTNSKEIELIFLLLLNYKNHKQHPVFLFRPPCSPSQRCKVYTQKGVMPATPSSHTLAQDSQAADVLTSDSMRHSIHFSSRTLPMLKLADIFSVSVLLFKI